jgi:putative component of membrane protein insertase Oxa1/YidC/SpoIIIJ protein YidD
MLGIVWCAFLAVGLGRPKGTVLRMIDWYQTNISAGRNLCSRPAGYNCSAFAVWAISSYGLLFGLTFAFLRMMQPCVEINNECYDLDGGCCDNISVEHRGRRDDYWWSKCILMSVLPMVMVGECSQRPAPRTNNACCNFLDCE